LGYANHSTHDHKLAVIAAQFIRGIFGIVGVALLVAAALSLPPYSSHGLGTGADEWDTQSFGWPVEIWSRKTHTYRTVEISPENGKVQETHYPTQYSIKWEQACLVFGGAVMVSTAVFLSLRYARAR
jgi:hypothetical protein